MSTNQSNPNLSLPHFQSPDAGFGIPQIPQPINQDMRWSPASIPAMQPTCCNGPPMNQPIQTNPASADNGGKSSAAPVPFFRPYHVPQNAWPASSASNQYTQQSLIKSSDYPLKPQQIHQHHTSDVGAPAENSMYQASGTNSQSNSNLPLPQQSRQFLNQQHDSPAQPSQMIPPTSSFSQYQPQMPPPFPQDPNLNPHQLSPLATTFTAVHQPPLSKPFEPPQAGQHFGYPGSLSAPPLSQQQQYSQVRPPDSTDVGASRLRGNNVPGQVQQLQPQQGSYTRQNSSRVSGMQLTAAEWNCLHCPINLISDWNLLPSDSPEIVPQPPINSPVNCNPDFMRCTLTTMPATSKLLSQCRLPLGLIIHPFRDVNDLPVIKTSVIVRCRSCRTYINPFVKFLDNNRRWRCPVCTLSNTVPDEFFYDPATQSYGDPSRRPEITSPNVEFIASSEYMMRPPQAATYLFCLEVSRNAIATGYLEFVCNILADQLPKLPGDIRRRIAFLTFDSGLQFYVLCGKSMRMMIVKDLSEVFLPDLEGLVNRINDQTDVLTTFIRNLPKEFENTSDTGNCLGFALQTALKLIGATGGRVTVFNTSIPSVGVGGLKHREEREDQTQPDVKRLDAATDFYKTLALDFAGAQVSVDLFFVGSNYCDIATLSGVSRHSGGSVYHYPGLHYVSKVSNADESNEGITGEFPLPKMPQTAGNSPTCDFLQVENLRRDLLRYLTRAIGFEAVFRIRCTRGLNVQNFYGCFFKRSVDLLSLPNVNPDAGYAIQMEITENLDDFSYVVIQSALLYTSACGDRRIRVHTLCLPVTDSPEAIFNYADQSAIACLITKMAVERTISAGLSNSREALSTVVADILSAYQRHRCGGKNTGSDAPYFSPTSMRLLPIFVCGALRFRAFKTHSPVPLDGRSAALELLINAPLSRILALIHPRLFALNAFTNSTDADREPTITLAQKAIAALTVNDDTSSDDAEKERIDKRSDGRQPGYLPLNAKCITRNGIYLLDTGFLLILLVGYDISAEDLTSLLSLQSIDEIRVDDSALELPPAPLGTLPKPRRQLESLIHSLRRERHLGTSLVLIRHDAPEPLKRQFIAALIEDRTDSAPSYQEFLQMVLNMARS